MLNLEVDSMEIAMHAEKLQEKLDGDEKFDKRFLNKLRFSLPLYEVFHPSAAFVELQFQYGESKTIRVNRKCSVYDIMCHAMNVAYIDKLHLIAEKAIFQLIESAMEMSILLHFYCIVKT